MSRNRNISSVLLPLLVTLLGCGVLFSFSVFSFDRRWLVVIIVLIVGFIFLTISKEKELFLLRVLIFLLPYGIGFVYYEFTQSDTIWAFDVVLFFLYVMWFIETRGFKSEKIYVAKTTVPALLMLLWSTLSIITAMSGVASSWGVFMSFKAFLVYFYITNRVTTKRQLMTIVNFMILVLAIQGAIGFAQRVLGRPLGLGFLGELQVTLWMELARVRGTLGYPNQYGAYLVLLLPMSASLYIFTKNKIKKMWYAVATVLGLFGVLFSLSRSAWLGIVGGVVVMIFLLVMRRRLSSGLLLTILGVLVIMMVIGVLFQNLIMLRLETGGSGEWRLVMINIALMIIASHPILGVGLFNYQIHSAQFFRWWHPVHNTYLRLAAETGLPGLFFFFWFIFLVLRNAYRGFRGRSRSLSAVGLGIFCGYTAFLLTIMFGPEYQHYRQKFLFWVLAGLAVVLDRIRKREILDFQKSRDNPSSVRSRPVDRTVGSRESSENLG